MSEQMADLRVEMATCRTDKEGRLGFLETWKKQQNGELRKIRSRMTGLLFAIILLLIGVVTNLVVDRSQPDVQAIVEQVIQSIDLP